MAITAKKTSSSYLLATPTTGANITLRTEEVIIDGNLNVRGATTTVTSTNTAINDQVIVLNYGETQAGISGTGGPTANARSSGITVDRGTLPNVHLVYSEAVQTWQLTNDGSVFANILTSGSGSGTALIHIVDDATPMLGANLNVNGYVIYANVGRNVNFLGNLAIGYTDAIPTTTVTNSVLYYTNPPSGGQTGLYVVNDATANDELITKKRAFGYSLLL